MTYVLILVACLTASSDDCRPERLPLPGITNATGCHLAGRLRLTEWLAQGHSIAQLAEVRCEAEASRSTASMPYGQADG